MMTDAALRAAAANTHATGKGRTLTDPGNRGDGRLVAMVRPMPAGPLVEFYARQISNGRRRLVKLGTWPALPLKQARAAFRALTPAIRQGDNVQQHVEMKRRERLELGTLGELCAAYAEHLERDGRRSAREVRRCLIEAPDAAARAIGNGCPACEVTPQDVATWLRPIHKRAPAGADQARRWLSAAYNWAATHENDYRIEAQAARRWGIIANPAAMVPANTAARRAGTRYLAPDEFRAVWCWLASEAGRTDGRATAALRIIMATGQRVEEILGLAAGQYDGGWLRWGTTKTGKPHGIPLPAKARLIFDSIQPNRHGLYFPGLKYPDKPYPARSLDYVTRRCAAALDIPPFCPRDLRRTWRTLAADLAGLSSEECARLQNHAFGPRAAEKHYNRADHAEMKAAAVGKWEKVLAGLMAPPARDTASNTAGVSVSSHKGQ